MSASRLIPCRICKKGHLHEATTVRSFEPPCGSVQVTLLTAQCDHCGKQTMLASQMEENLRRLSARKAHYGGLPLGEDIFILRRNHALSLKASAKIFGLEPNELQSLEDEQSFPAPELADKLISAMQSPDFLKELADQAGVELPLWEAHHTEA